MINKIFHIKNIKNEKLSIFVINAQFGNIEREKVFNETPSKAILDKAFKFLQDEYDFDPTRHEYTLEGIDSTGVLVPTTNYVTDKTGKIAKEGVSYAEDRNPSMMVPSSPISSPESENSEWSRSQPLPGDPDYVPSALEDKYLSDPVTLTGNLSRPINDDDQERNAVKWQQYQELLKATFLAAGQVQNFEALFGDEQPSEPQPANSVTETNLSRMIDNIVDFRGTKFDLSGFNSSGRSQGPGSTDTGGPNGWVSGGRANITDPAPPGEEQTAPLMETANPFVGPCWDGTERKPIPTREKLLKFRRMCENDGNNPDTWACRKLAEIQVLIDHAGCPEDLEDDEMTPEQMGNYGMYPGPPGPDIAGMVKADKEMQKEEAEEAENEELTGDPKKPPPSPTASEAVKQDGLPGSVKKYLESLSPTELLKNAGIGGTHIPEPVPRFTKAATEKVIANKHNAWIVLGRDRAHPTAANRLSGYGGKGHTQCAAIDIVVGRMSPKPREVNSDNEKLYVDPIFNVTPLEGSTIRGAGGPAEYAVDAARIYISQKTDIDANFQLVDGKVGSSVARSGIGIKADAVRIIGNEGIKLVTRSDGSNSQGGPITKIRGVDIIADNRHWNLQPMILGNNLNSLLSEMFEILDSVVGSVQSLLNDQIMLNSALSNHIHVATGPAAPTSPSPMLMPLGWTLTAKQASVDSFSTVSEKWNMVRAKMGYLERGGPMSIRSRFNNVN